MPSPFPGLGFYLEKSASLRKNRPMKSYSFCIPVDEVLHVRNGASLITSSIRDANTDKHYKGWLHF